MRSVGDNEADNERFVMRTMIACLKASVTYRKFDRDANNRRCRYAPGEKLALTYEPYSVRLRCVLAALRLPSTEARATRSIVTHGFGIVRRGL